MRSEIADAEDLKTKPVSILGGSKPISVGMVSLREFSNIRRKSCNLSNGLLADSCRLRHWQTLHTSAGRSCLGADTIVSVCGLCFPTAILSSLFEPHHASNLA